MTELETLCERYEITIRCDFLGTRKEGDWECRHFLVTLGRGPTAFETPFSQGMAHTQNPTAADVLNCLVSDADCGDRSFEEFCSDLGYSEDSRKAFAAWEQCRTCAPRVRALLGDHFEEFLRAEH